MISGWYNVCPSHKLIIKSIWIGAFVNHRTPHMIYYDSQVESHIVPTNPSWLTSIDDIEEPTTPKTLIVCTPMIWWHDKLQADWSSKLENKKTISNIEIWEGRARTNLRSRNRTKMTKDEPTETPHQLDILFSLHNICTTVVYMSH